MISGRRGLSGLAVVLGAVAMWMFAGCSGDAALEPEGGGSMRLLERPAAARAAGSGVITVGKWMSWAHGGTLVVERDGIGRTTLTIPPRSMDRYYAYVTLSVSTQGIVDVELGPEGLNFSNPAVLELSYAGADFDGDVQTLRVFYDNHVFWEEVPSSEADENAMAVRAGLAHFSRYAIGSVE